MFNLFKKSEVRPVAMTPAAMVDTTPDSAPVCAPGNEAAPAPPIRFQDRRLFLKLKLKSLAAEARIIRAEELRPRTRRGLLGGELCAHRTGIVRAEARHTLLAYGFLRGRPYRRIEATAREAPAWAKVETMLRKYGAAFGGNWRENERETARMLERFQQWKADS